MLNPYQTPDFNSLANHDFNTISTPDLARLFYQLKQQRDDILSVVFHLVLAITQQHDAAEEQDRQAQLKKRQEQPSSQLADEAEVKRQIEERRNQKAKQRQFILDVLYTLTLPHITSADHLTLVIITNQQKVCSSELNDEFSLHLQQVQQQQQPASEQEQEQKQELEQKQQKKELSQKRLQQHFGMGLLELLVLFDHAHLLAQALNATPELNHDTANTLLALAALNNHLDCAILICARKAEFTEPVTAEPVVEFTPATLAMNFKFSNGEEPAPSTTKRYIPSALSILQLRPARHTHWDEVSREIQSTPKENLEAASLFRVPSPASVVSGLVSRAQLQNILLFACHYGALDVVHECLKAGARASHQYEEHELGTALNVAARLGDLRLMNLLIEAGAQINTRHGQLGLSALVIAAKMGHADVVQLLLAKGAPHEFSPTQDERYAVDWSLSTRSQPLTTMCLYAALKKSITSQQWTNVAKQRLNWAARAGDINAAHWLLQEGAGRHDAQSLTHAVIGHHSDMVQLLLQHVDVKSAEEKYFPLHFAIIHFAPVAIVEMLIVAGMDIAKKHPSAGTVEELMETEGYKQAINIMSKSKLDLLTNCIATSMYYPETSEIIAGKKKLLTLSASFPQQQDKKQPEKASTLFAPHLHRLVGTLQKICDHEMTSARLKFSNATLIHLIDELHKKLTAQKPEDELHLHVMTILQTTYTNAKALNQELRVILITLALLEKFRKMRQHYLPPSFFDSPVSLPEWAPPPLEPKDMKLINKFESTLNSTAMTFGAMLQFLKELHQLPRLCENLNFETHSMLLRRPPNQILFTSLIDQHLEHDQSKHPQASHFALIKMFLFNRGAHPARRGAISRAPLDILIIIFNYMNNVKGVGTLIPNYYLDDSSVNKEHRYHFRRDILAGMKKSSGKNSTPVAQFIRWLDTSVVHPYTLLTAPLSCSDHLRLEQLLNMALHGTTAEKRRLVNEVLFLLNLGLEEACAASSAAEQAKQNTQGTQIEKERINNTSLDSLSIKDEVEQTRTMLKILAPTATSTQFLDLIIYLNTVLQNSDSELLKTCISHEFKKTPLEMSVFLEQVIDGLTRPKITITLKN